MTDQFRNDLDRFVRSQVASGRYPCEGDVLRDVRAWLDARESGSPTLGKEREPIAERAGANELDAGPLWGIAREDAELIDQIVADAMRDRERRYRTGPHE